MLAREVGPRADRSCSLRRAPRSTPAEVDPPPPPIHMALAIHSQVPRRWAAGAGAGTLFSWPLSGSPAVVRAFQAPALPYGPGHRGVDLAAVPGAPVLAAGAGTVVFAGTVASRGVVSVDHSGGLRTTYEPVSPSVSAGDHVARGEQIG